MVTPDLQQNIMVTVYLTFAHNYIALAYLLGMLIGIVMAVWKPSRYAIFIFLGFAILLFSFEYDKHIIEPLRSQTTTSLVTEKPHYKVSKIVDVVIADVLPIVFYTTGWGMLFTAIVYGGIKLGKKK
jgi:Na+/phosphate symporter